MQISSNTLSILKNFSSINQSIAVEAGNVIRTISPSKTIMGIAEVAETFEKDFCVYDLNQFLSAVGLFKEPAFIFEDNYVRIKENKSSVKFTYADPQMVMHAPKKTLTLPDVVVEFALTPEVLKSTLQASSILQAPHWRVVGDESSVKIVVSDSANESSNAFSVEVGETKLEFDLKFRIENMKFMMNHYNVKIASRGISHFATEDGKLQYYIATESN